jgi:hypothetical protein
LCPISGAQHVDHPVECIQSLRYRTHVRRINATTDKFCPLHPGMNRPRTETQSAQQNRAQYLQHARVLDG